MKYGRRKNFSRNEIRKKYKNEKWDQKKNE